MSTLKNEDLIEDIMVWETKRLWVELKRISNDNANARKTLEEVKRGYSMDIPIWYFTEQWYNIYPSGKRDARS